MQAGNIFIMSKGTKVVLVITFSVCLLAVLFAFFYYRNLNSREDPRIKSARELLIRYDKESARINPLDAFPLLDSAQAVFRSYRDYESSFETGLIYNNKSSALLMIAIYDSAVTEYEKQTLLDLSMKYCDSSIVVYSNWIKEWGELPEKSIAERMAPMMDNNDPAFAGLNFPNIFAARVKNISIAQIETPRRLSVSLTNKGTIFRHLLLADSALVCYNKALTLWKENRTAKSNLSVLMGGEPVKPTIIESLFPPDKNRK
jgi:tetratricopeptide (TPR) repeat protein